MSSLPSFYHILSANRPENWQKDICYSEAQLFQLRIPGLTANALIDHARMIYPWVVQRNARLMVNLSLEAWLANEHSLQRCCHGVHLSQKHLECIAKIAWKKPDQNAWWVGASCHDETSIQWANDCSLDFITLSPVKKTSSHPLASTLGWHHFEALASAAAMPVYALGGLTPQDLPCAVEKGARGVAGISHFNRLE